MYFNVNQKKPTATPTITPTNVPTIHPTLNTVCFEYYIYVLNVLNYVINI